MQVSCRSSSRAENWAGHSGRALGRSQKRTPWRGERAISRGPPQPGFGLAGVYKDAHLFAQAERFLRRVHQYDEAHPADDPEQQALRLFGFGEFYRDRGQYVKAEPLVAKAVNLLVKKYGPEHIQVARWSQHLAGSPSARDGC